MVIVHLLLISPKKVVRVTTFQCHLMLLLTRNKTVRAVRLKADNILQVGSGYYSWYQSWLGQAITFGIKAEDGSS